MVTTAEFISELREWIGTPYVHQGRVKGVGVDCIGLAIGAIRDLGLGDYEPDYGYAYVPDGLLCDRIAVHLEETDEPQDGDLLVFRIRTVPQHCAFLTEGGTCLLHAYQGLGVVAEHGYTDQWRGRLIKAFKVGGLD
jgi:NlpC/P60 family putative phage cell wall peptidase